MSQQTKFHLFQHSSEIWAFSSYCFFHYCRRFLSCPRVHATQMLLFRVHSIICGPGSSVGIATDYGLDGSGSNPGGDEIFRLSRPALGPTQPPVQWVKCGWGVLPTTHPLLVPRSWNSRAILIPTLWAALGL